jgi:hypothetical protein
MKTYPDKDEDLGVSDAVLALRHPDHGELGRTLTLRHQVAYLEYKKYLVKLVAKDAFNLLNTGTPTPGPAPVGTKSIWSKLWQKMP